MREKFLTLSLVMAFWGKTVMKYLMPLLAKAGKRSDPIKSCISFLNAPLASLESTIHATPKR